jgi:hypothetical protein
MSGFGLIQLACSKEPELYGFVAVTSFSLHLSDDTRPDLDCRN